MVIHSSRDRKQNARKKKCRCKLDVGRLQIKVVQPERALVEKQGELTRDAVQSIKADVKLQALKKLRSKVRERFRLRGSTRSGNVVCKELRGGIDI